MAYTIELPNNVPISELEHTKGLSSESLFLASQQTTQTHTGYVSKYFKYETFANDICDIFNLTEIKDCIEDISANKAIYADILCNWICCDVNNPFVISSLYQGVSVNNHIENNIYAAQQDKLIGILLARGYRLSAGIKTVFTNLDSNPITNIIPSLNQHKQSVTNSNSNFITSITDYHGHIRNYGTVTLNNILTNNNNFQLVTKTSENGNYISSITSKDGKLDRIGQQSFNNVVGTVEYCDITNVGNINENYVVPLKPFNVKIAKLRMSQLKNLSSQNKISKDVIYMTIDEDNELRVPEV